MTKETSEENNTGGTINPFGTLAPDAVGENFSAGNNEQKPAQQQPPKPAEVVINPEPTRAKNLIEPTNILEDQLESVNTVETKTDEPNSPTKIISETTKIQSAPKPVVEKITPLEKVEPTKKSIEQSTLQDIENQSRASIKKTGSSIRTFHSDVSETVREQKFSVADIALAEQRKRVRTPVVNKETPRRSFKSIIIIAIGVVFVLAGVFGVYIALESITGEEAPPDFSHETLIFVNEQLEVPATNLSRNQTISLLEEVRGATSLSLGEIADIQLTTSSLNTNVSINASYFFDLLDARASATLKRALLNDFMLGIHMFDRERYFLIFKTDSFDGAFAEMLKWENNIEDDLLFIVRETDTEPTEEASFVDTTTTTPETSQKPLAEIQKNKFVDIVIKNRDVRAVFGDDGKPIFMYSFPDKETLVITSNANTLAEIFDRLTSARFQ